MKPEIHWELQLNRPFILKEAFVYARDHESRLEGLKLVMNKADNEAASFESGEETKEVGDEMTYPTAETKTNENIDDGVTNTNAAAEIIGNIDVETEFAEHVET